MQLEPPRLTRITRPDHAPIHGLRLATINLPTKFEVSICTHYEDMKGDTKYGKWDRLACDS